MDIEQTINNLFDSLGKRERAVARVILSNYPVSALSTVAKLSEASGVSTATVLRLVNKLGYSTYGDFQNSIKEDLQHHVQSPFDRLQAGRSEQSSEAGRRLHQVMAKQVSTNILNGFNETIVSDLDAALELLFPQQKQIFVAGGRHSIHIARLFGTYLSIFRDGVQTVDGDPNTWARYLNAVNAKTTIIVFDIRRYQKSIQNFAKLGRNLDAKVILITDSWADPDEFQADYQFQIASDTDSPLDSLVGQLAFAEAMIAEYVNKNKEVALDRLAQFEEHNTKLAE